MRCSQSESANVNLCPLQARVWFEPFCLNYADVCTKGMTIAIRYEVGLRVDFEGDVKVPTSIGEFYVPLQKGIQLKNLLTQNDEPLSPNSKGIYTVEKFYGHSGQDVRGLRIEAQVANPSGLVSMKIQYRELTGPSAKDFSDVSIPEALNQKNWNDLLTPGDEGAGEWSVNLNGATPNQIFNFGTQINSIANSRIVPTSFKVGSNDLPLDPKYRWTIDQSGNYVAPVFKSGFYQFRIIASDSLGGTIESSNYITVRVIPRPEFRYVNDNINLQRDCQNTTENYSVFVADDEALLENKLTVNGQVVNTPVIVGTDGVITFTFEKNQLVGNYPIVLTLKNRFSDVPLDNQIIVPATENTRLIQLSNVPVTLNNLYNEPLNFIVGSSGSVKASLSSGNCCTSTPSVSWEYSCSPFFSASGFAGCSTGSRLLDGAPNSAMTCNVNGNSRSCGATITASVGNAESPSMSNPPANIRAILNVNSSDPACTPTDLSISKHIPILSHPKISFYMKESLWLDLPPGGNGPNPALEPVNPKVYVRIDFPPNVDVSVDVVNATNLSEVFCTITFTQGTGTSPVDKPCAITRSNFTGSIMLVKNPASINTIKLETEPLLVTHKAKLEGNISHTFCRANIASLQDQSQTATYTVQTEHPMLNSPYGITRVNGVDIQDPQNDYNLWTAGSAKQLRCYDNWGAIMSSSNYVASAYPSHTQDYYEVFKYNEARTSYMDRKNWAFHFSFSTFQFPNFSNGQLDTNSKNVPYLYLVSQNGDAPWGTKWSYLDDSGSTASTIPVNFEPVTSQLCSGDSTLNQIVLYRIKASVETGNPNVVMKAVSGVSGYMGYTSGVYSYLFMCHYGRWHPSGKTYNTWTN